jgi:ribosomal subunit interface protein
MKVQVNTGHNIEGSEELNKYIDSSLSESFDRYSVAITRIEVHLSDENAGKAGAADKRCLLEARLSNHQPVAVSHHADNIYVAIDTASDKLLRSLDKIAGKLTEHKSPKDLIVDLDTGSEEE